MPAPAGGGGFDYDIVIVGGGIHGVGVAQAAAAAGHRVLLLEKTALASGTSSRSSKLIHGGLRYLESFELSLVRESLRERALLLRLAPDLVRLVPFHIPVFRSTRRRPLLIRAGLSLYALLGNLRPACRFRRLPRSRWDDLDGLLTRDLQAVYRYFDGQTDDALLTEAVMRSAMSLGAELRVPARFVGAELGAGGCEVRYLSASHGPTDRDETVDRRDTAARGDTADQSETVDESDAVEADETTDEGDATRVADMAAATQLTCRARVLINAAGPWVHQVLKVVIPAQRKVPIELVQGAHVEVRGRLEHGIYYVESPRDGRAVFFMPRGEMTLVGTTEVRFRGDDPGDVHALRCERIYLARLIRRYFPRLLPDGRQGIVRAWAGIRVLPAGSGHAFHRSRETVFAADRENGEGPPRLLSIYGGKLTTYRSTAQKVMERIAPALPARKPVADTAKLPLTPP